MFCYQRFARQRQRDFLKLVLFAISKKKKHIFYKQKNLLILIKKKNRKYVAYFHKYEF